MSLEGHDGAVPGVSWHPAGEVLATAGDDGVRLWEPRSGGSSVLWELDTTAKGVAWSPDGSRLAVTDGSGGVGVWDPATNSRVLYARPHSKSVFAVQWSADGRLLVTGGTDSDVCVLSATDLTEIRRISSGRGGVWQVALSPDAQLIACGHADSTVRVLETRTGREVAILEGHDNGVMGVAFSSSGDLLATATYANIRVWRPSDWECVMTLPGGWFNGVGGLAFHPQKPWLAAKDDQTARIDCWALDLALLADKTAEPRSRRYVNAKVMLLGDTGVGKSGLGLVLSGQPYAPTDSTHGRNVWVFDPEDGDERQPGSMAREVLLWDLAGQPGYRMVHQLHLNEVAVALIVFDARSETDPFAGVKHWARALGHARRLEGDDAVPVRVFLVAARADRGGVSATAGRVQALIDELGMDGFFETSAKEGMQIAELRQAMLDAISWELLPTVSSNAVFEEIRGFLAEAKGEGRVLATVHDLHRDYVKTRPGGSTADSGLRSEFAGCVGRVESRGLIRRLRFGDYVLLEPQLLDAYASALVQAAKDEPDGLAVIAEEDALAGRFRLSESERVPGREQEKLLLIAMVEELLRHEVALKETTDAGVDLVFPSQFTRERPDAPDIPGRELVYGFEGSLHNVYATLAVRLARSHLFTRREMWRNAATYASTAGGVCGIYLREIEEGIGELQVFFDDDAGTAVRRQFETYVLEHLRQRAGPGTVTTRRVRSCPVCRYVLPDDLVKRKVARGDRAVRCPDCERHMIALVDGKDHTASQDAAVTAMHLNANAGRDTDVAATRLKGKIETDDFDVFLCHNGKDKSEVKEIGERLRERGIHVWLDEWEIPPGTRWQKQLEKQLRSIKSAAVFIGSRSPGPWQEIETELLLQQFAKRERPLIPVILPSRRGKPRLPGYLSLWHLVDMRKPSPDPFEQLVWGITGERARS